MTIPWRQRFGIAIDEKRIVNGKRLTLPAALEDGKVPVAFNRFAYVSCALLVATILWASVAEFKELAIAHGQVVPSGSVKLVHHLEGGEIKEIFVSEGQMVNPGDIIIKLSPISASSDLQQLKVRAAHLFLSKIRLTSLINGKIPDFGQVGLDYPNLKQDQQEVFAKQKSLIEKERATSQARVKRESAEIKALSDELQSLTRQVEIQQEQFAIRESLLKKGYMSRRSFLEAKSSLESARTRVISTRGRIETSREKLNEAKSQLASSEAEYKEKFAQERSKIEEELAELVQSTTKHQDRFDRLELRSPVRGIIQTLEHKTPGEVVKPGSLVAKIVPVDEDIVAEVELLPKDIGHVKTGDTAELKISTFDPNVYGVVKGSVAVLSASTFQKENGDTYYKAIIKLEKNFVGSASAMQYILPGMVVQADIITGAKSLVRYMLKPIFRSLDTAFSER